MSEELQTIINLHINGQNADMNLKILEMGPYHAASELDNARKQGLITLDTQCEIMRKFMMYGFYMETAVISALNNA